MHCAGGPRDADDEALEAAPTVGAGPKRGRLASPDELAQLHLEDVITRIDEILDPSN